MRELLKEDPWVHFHFIYTYHGSAGPNPGLLGWDLITGGMFTPASDLVRKRHRCINAYSVGTRSIEISIEILKSSLPFASSRIQRHRPPGEYTGHDPPAHAIEVRGLRRSDQSETINFSPVPSVTSGQPWVYYLRADAAYCGS